MGSYSGMRSGENADKRIHLASELATGSKAMEQASGKNDQRNQGAAVQSASANGLSNVGPAKPSGS